MSTEIPYCLPKGELSSILGGATESFSFHYSPQSFIASRVKPSSEVLLNVPSLPRLEVIRARILNRNVAIVTSYLYVRDILNESEDTGEASSLCNKAGIPLSQPAFEACPAYNQLMKDFFPPPNLLLLDGPEHNAHKSQWKSRISPLIEGIKPLIATLVKEHFCALLLRSSESSHHIDLYTSMKALSEILLLQTFLNLSPSDPLFSEISSHQSSLLRGQFSLFPVSISVPFFRSARNIGISSRKALQKALRAHAKDSRFGCPFAAPASNPGSTEQEEDVANHLLLATSSLATKGLASLLTALLLNLFLWRPSTSTSASLGHELRSLSPFPSQRDSLLQSVIAETERLSPPVIGVMRRAKTDVVLRSSSSAELNTLIPASWDTWLYFPSAVRDSTVFGADAEHFHPRRYLDHEVPVGFAFGAGGKECLGAGIARMFVKTVAEICIDGGVEMTGSVEDEDVRGWLGWPGGVWGNMGKEEDGGKRGMKQLPTQRPAKGILVTFTGGQGLVDEDRDG